jgi:hypothetical protein
MGEWATNSSWLERHVPDARVREAMRNALLSVSDSEVQVGGASERVCVKLPVLYAYCILLYYIYIILYLCTHTHTHTHAHTHTHTHTYTHSKHVRE